VRPVIYTAAAAAAAAAVAAITLAALPGKALFEAGMDRQQLVPQQGSKAAAAALPGDGMFSGADDTATYGLNSSSRGSKDNHSNAELGFNCSSSSNQH
jgi:hypothetical protein